MNYAFGEFKSAVEASKALNESGVLRKKDHIKTQGVSEKECLMAFFNAIEIIEANDELSEIPDEIFDWYSLAVEAFNNEGSSENDDKVDADDAAEDDVEVGDDDDVKDDVEEVDEKHKEESRRTQTPPDKEGVSDVDRKPLRRGRKPKVVADKDQAEDSVADAKNDSDNSDVVARRRGRQSNVKVEDVAKAEAVEPDDKKSEEAGEVVGVVRRRVKKNNESETDVKATENDGIVNEDLVPVEDLAMDHSAIPQKPRVKVSSEESAFTKAMGLMYKASMKGVEISVEELCKKTDTEEIYMKEVRRKMCNVLRFVLDNDLSMEEIQAIIDNEPAPARSGRPVDPMTERRTIRRRD